MSNSRRWREFITWWNKTGSYMLPIEYGELIDDKIEEIKRNNGALKELIQSNICPAGQLNLETIIEVKE